MDAIITLLGLLIGTAIFLFVMSKVTAIVYNCSSVGITFLFCWGIGIVLSWIAWKIAIIVGIIALILFIISKITGKKDKNTSQSDSTINVEESADSNNSDDKTNNT